jgi:predicted nucleotide-binding protein
MEQSRNIQIRDLVSDLQQELTFKTGTLVPLLTRAVRLAHLVDEPEYRLLFEFHLSGISMTSTLPSVTPWTQKSGKPRWDPVQAYFEDRALPDGKLHGADLASIEFMLRETCRVREKHPNEASLMQHERNIVAILGRIQSRVTIFTNLIESRSTRMHQNLHGGNAKPSIFIGHGRSSVWRELKDFLEDRLHLRVVEFNRESTAGISTVERLNEMLDDSNFAFLVLTGEDENRDGSLHARENVVHEAGLFQGRLGFRRAIVILESNCKEFSNIQGLGQIRFQVGELRSKFEDVRHVLEREGILV